MPDIILLDLNLPRKDGRKYLADIKADEHLRFIPVIIPTTSDSEQDISRAYSLYANRFVTKTGRSGAVYFYHSAIEIFWFQVTKLPTRHKYQN